VEKLLHNIFSVRKAWLLPALLLAGCACLKAQQPGQKPGPRPVYQTEGEKEAASKRIHILHANYLSIEKMNDESVQKLIGNVRILQDSTYFYCDSAYHFEQSNQLKAFGHVKVEMPDSVVLLANRMDYDGNEKVAYVYDDIVLTDHEVVLTTDRLVYYRLERYGKYEDGGQIKNEQDTLTSMTGYYYPDEHKAYFRENVDLKSPDYTLATDTLGYHTELKIAYFMSPTIIVSDDGEILATRGTYDSRYKKIELFERSVVKDSTYILTADSLFYTDSTNFGLALGNIFIQQEDSSLEIRGNYGTFNRQTNESVVTQGAVAIQYMDDDTLYMFADTLYSRKDSNDNRIFRAYHHLSFYMNEMQGKADSMVYFFTDSMMILYADPVLWSDMNQLTGDTVRIWMKASKADSMWVGRNSFMVGEEDTVGYNQIKGKEMRAKFRDNQLARLHVIGNSESIYYNKNDEGHYEGMNECIAQEMIISLVDNEVRKIRFNADPEGKYHPIHEVLFQEFQLDGMRWRIAERPLRPQPTSGGSFRPLFHGQNGPPELPPTTLPDSEAPNSIPQTMPRLPGQGTDDTKEGSK